MKLDPFIEAAEERRLTVSKRHVVLFEVSKSAHYERRNGRPVSP